MNKYETMTFDIANTKDMSEFVRILLTNDRVCTIRREEQIYIVEYNYDVSCNYGNAIPVWLTPTEEESVVYDNEVF